ncbi:hypothetical protein D9758_015938 [Tetrapyrgos nigripes]|uniref:DUF6589 domain-containing protein n=1 Tax=Tetrapyrgos nigripes TaxID=182062 RepID=A0A8H5C8R0_9AGAR|nr:hypothetical protein D9758_015938 [Tetrapyrgos nigripes]
MQRQGSSFFLTLGFRFPAFTIPGRTRFSRVGSHISQQAAVGASNEPMYYCRDIVLNNWLLNLKGKPDCFLEVDLVQEHLNYWIKTIYKAHGSNSSWEWLSMISPCVEVFRKLATNINDSCGEARQGSRHAPPDLSKDIRILMDSLREHGVYKITKGRVFDVDDSLAKDVITEGLCNLSSPLAEYNAAFKRLQRRRRQMPITGGLDPGLEEFVSSDMRESAGDELRVDVKEDVEGVEEVTDLAEDVFEGDIARAIDDEEVQTFTLDNEEDVALDIDVVEVTW